MILVVIFGLALGIPLLMFAVLHIEWFVVVGVLAAICVPASLVKPDGFNVDAADILLGVALASWIINFGVGRVTGPRLGIGRGYFSAAFGFWVVNALSWFWSVNGHATLGFTVQLAELILVFPLVLSALPTSLKLIRVGIYVMLAITTVLAVITIGKYTLHHGLIASGTSLLGFGKNPLGSFIAAGSVLAFTLAFGSQRWQRRALMVALALIGLLGTLATDSRGALLGLVGALLIVGALMESGRVNKKIGVILVAIFVAGAYFGVLAPARHAQQTEAGSYSSTTLRYETWKDAIHKIEHKPLLGSGARTYEDHIKGGALPDPNNLFLLTWAEVGIPGMIALLALLYQVIRLILRVRHLPPQTIALGVGAAGITVSLLIHFQVDVSWSRGETTLAYAMVGLMIAVLRLSAAESVPEPAGDPAASESRREPLAV